MNKGTDMREKPSYKDTQKRSASFCRKDWGSGHFACPCRSVKILTGVYHHDQQAGEYAHIVQESNAFHVILSCFFRVKLLFYLIAV